ncbi:hypothetical protein GEMRC1_009360 [Eukaryota sp. GEM-RC1]
MTLFQNLSTSGVIVILPKGELVLKNSTITFEESDSYLHSDLFLFYYWINSSNQIDISANHDHNAIIIDGPEWKTDDVSGFFDITPGNTLHVPNIPGEFGWRDASISLWIYFEDGGFGFGWSTCRFIIQTNYVNWGNGWRNIQFPLNKWFHLVITFDQSEGRIYVDGNYQGDFSPNSPYRCTNGPPSHFSLSGIEGSSTQFKGRIRAVQVFTKTLTTLEINLLTFDRHARIWGQGKLSIVDSEMTISPAYFRIELIFLVSSNMYLDRSVTNKLRSIELAFSDVYYDVMDPDAELIIDSIYLKNTSSIITSASLIVSNFHWFDGELFSPEILTLKGLFLYGDSKNWPLESLIIENELYCNNSLTFLISHLSLITVSATCFRVQNLLLIPLLLIKVYLKSRTSFI